MGVTDDTQPIHMGNLIDSQDDAGWEPLPAGDQTHLLPSAHTEHVYGYSQYDGSSFIRALTSVAQAMRDMDKNARTAGLIPSYETLEVGVERNYSEDRTLTDLDSVIRLTRSQVIVDCIAVSETTTDPAQPEKKE